ncbi:MAG: family 10 glycosylhydrolase [Muribaculaceae bacterium]|nr:family 10 glycosylhydrolase [Muribaculaceae bacterium]
MRRLLLTLSLAVAALTALAAGHAPKNNIMWLDLSGMWTRFTCPDSVDYYMDKIVDCGFNTVVIDVRNTGSSVGYKSDIAPRLLDWKGVRIDPSYDYLDVVLKSAKAHGLTSYAAFNIFCESYPWFVRGGGVLSGDTLAWRSQNYVPGKGIIPAPENEGPGTAFCNPALKQVQDYEQSLVLECASRYPVDGILVDRCRYDNITSDFSPQSLRMFEEYAGVKVDRFPEDIYEWVERPDGSYDRVEGPHFKKWLEWRASVIYNFFADTRAKLKAINPDLKFGAYTGAWYPSYYEVGVNWAGPEYDPSEHFDWATPRYREYALAPLLDLYTNGNYYKCISLDDYYSSNGLVKNETDSQWQTGDHLCVEGACRYSRMLLGDRPFQGGLYVVDYDTDVNEFKRAVEMNIRESDGVMVFELAHIIRTGWFDALREAVHAAMTDD